MPGVHAPARGEVAQDVEEGARDARHLGVVDARAARAERLQRRPVRELLHEEEAAALLAVVHVARHGGVRELAQRGGLTLEELELLPRLEAPQRELLHRHARAALRVLRRVRRAAGALAELALDAVAAEHHLTGRALCTRAVCMLALSNA